MKKYNKLIFGVGIELLVLITFSISYAFFSTGVKINNGPQNMTVQAGTLSLEYIDGPEVVAERIQPGWSTTKEITVKNTGTLEASFNLIWQELTNEIINNEMVLSATCTRLNSSGSTSGTCLPIGETPITSDKMIRQKITIDGSTTHKYTITIAFKETNAAQDYNQGKKFGGVLGIEEYALTQFEKDDWSTIVSNVKSGNISDYNIGDTKKVDLGTYGTHTLRLANTTTPTECSTAGFSQTACGFVLEFEDIITTKAMNSTNTNVGGWPASSMYTFVNTDIYNAIPEELRNGIIDTTVVSGHGSTSGETNFTSTDKLYLLSTGEIWANGTSGSITWDSARTLTRQLDYYKMRNVTTSNYSGAIKKNGTSAYYWWLRAAYSSNANSFNFVSINGSYIYDSIASSSGGVAPAFRLG